MDFGETGDIPRTAAVDPYSYWVPTLWILMCRDARVIKFSKAPPRLKRHGTAHRRLLVAHKALPPNSQPEKREARGQRQQSRANAQASARAHGGRRGDVDCTRGSTFLSLLIVQSSEFTEFIRAKKHAYFFFASVVHVMKTKQNQQHLLKHR